MNKKHIFLCGFMGSGKTSHGKKLARIMQMPFADLDEKIESGSGKTVSRIFEEEGETFFRELETLMLIKIIESEEPSVVALGGGTLGHKQNLELVRTNGILVYIELTAAALTERLKNARGQRPLLRDVPESGLLQHITELLRAREQFYKQAELIVPGIDLDPKELAKKLIDLTK